MKWRMKKKKKLYIRLVKRQRSIRLMSESFWQLSNKKNKRTRKCEISWSNYQIDDCALLWCSWQAIQKELNAMRNLVQIWLAAGENPFIEHNSSYDRYIVCLLGRRTERRLCQLKLIGTFFKTKELKTSKIKSKNSRMQLLFQNRISPPSAC